MPKLNVLNINGQNVGEIELVDSIFNVEVNQEPGGMHRDITAMVLCYQSNCTQGCGESSRHRRKL